MPTTQSAATPAAERWAKAVNADGTYSHWQYAIATKPEKVNSLLDAAIAQAAS